MKQNKPKYKVLSNMPILSIVPPKVEKQIMKIISLIAPYIIQRKERLKEIELFMKNNPPKMDTHGGYERNKEKDKLWAELHSIRFELSSLWDVEEIKDNNQ